ncbi:Ribosomal protein L21 [Syntrophomonas zehnderi OL-4]|uniref:Large ribosomal subunit protein bL21 n=1 Tax=Syntrophomonas zehnderi OL-4 TaxID=690567 RepID=A0A0E4C903_9FIRM|nr:50S ribosomal protein L21 [Syntrophomonas zehnderi]CFX80275.1 Ribosomal protein L21 [Syntrophomonas zehnderi OL-4]
MYAIVQTGGKQYKVAVGQMVLVEKLNAEVGEKVTLDQVLMLKDDNGTRIGNPLVAGASIVGKVVEQGRGKKITVYKYKKRKNMRKKQGHRQPYTRILIEKIEG